MSSHIVAKGAMFIYVETIIAMASGYIFWFIMSQITSAENIGLSSTVISLTTIFSTISSLGIPVGVQRFLGKSFSDNEKSTTNEFVKSSIVLTIFGIVVSSFIFIMLENWLYITFEIDLSLLIISILLIISTSLMSLFRSIVISTLNTKMLPLIMIVGVFVKTILGLILVLFNYGALGVTIGFVFFPTLGTILYACILYKMVRSEKPGPISKIKYYKDVVTSGLANWIPSIIYTIGSHLGTLLVFGSHGSLEAGVYFIAFSLSMAVTALMSALYSIAYPALSSMRDGRKRFAWRTIKFSLIFSLPLSVSILFYSSDILNIFGHEYANGSQTLEILMMSILPTAISAGIINLSYSYGDYRNVLIIGLASNIPRTILYFALVPYLEGIGAALSYTIGAIFGLIFSLWVSKKIGLIINLRDVVSVLIVPILVVVLFYFVHLNFILEIVISLGCSYLILILIRVVTLSDLRDIFKLFPNRLSHPLLKVIDMIENKEENL